MQGVLDIARLSDAYIPAKNIARATRFYEQKLGFKPRQESADGVVYEFGEHTRWPRGASLRKATLICSDSRGVRSPIAPSPPWTIASGIKHWQSLPNVLFQAPVPAGRCAMTMNINLTPQLEELVRQKVSSGLYNSASEVVREALRLMEREDQVRAAKLAQLRQDIQEGLQSGSAGELDVQAIKRRGRERLAAAKRR
jgi:antitoxin ParD1/3/4